MTQQRKARVKSAKKTKFPQKAPKNNYFTTLMQTEEGRELRKQWSNKPRKNAGRPKAFLTDTQSTTLNHFVPKLRRKPKR